MKIHLRPLLIWKVLNICRVFLSPSSKHPQSLTFHLYYTFSFRHIVVCLTDVETDLVERTLLIPTTGPSPFTGETSCTCSKRRIYFLCFCPNLSPDSESIETRFSPWDQRYSTQESYPGSLGSLRFLLGFGSGNWFWNRSELVI